MEVKVEAIKSYDCINRVRKNLNILGQLLVLKDRVYSLKSRTNMENKWLDVQMRQNHAVTQELAGATKAMLAILKNLPDFA